MAPRVAARPANPAEGDDLATRGLVNLGFREPEARHALATVNARHRNDAARPPIEEVLREALAVLT